MKTLKKQVAILEALVKELENQSKIQSEIAKRIAKFNIKHGICAILLVFSLSISAQKVDTLINIKGHLFMTMTLNSKKATFIIDSGSTWSLIDISKSKVYGFDFMPFGDQKYAGIGGTESIQMVYNDTISETKQNFYGVNLEKMNGFIKAQFGIEIAGILGADFLNNSEAILNFKHNTITYVQ
jgi:hypothetical protein